MEFPSDNTLATCASATEKEQLAGFIHRLSVELEEFFLHHQAFLKRSYEELTQRVEQLRRFVHYGNDGNGMFSSLEGPSQLAVATPLRHGGIDRISPRQGSPPYATPTVSGRFYVSPGDNGNPSTPLNRAFAGGGGVDGRSPLAPSTFDERLDGGGEWGAVSMANARPSPPRVGESSGVSPFRMASPQSQSKHSLEELLARFDGAGALAGPDIGAGSIFEQLAGYDEAPPAPGPAAGERAADVIPIDTLRPLHDQHLTTGIRAVYRSGRPVIVPIPGGAANDPASLAIDPRRGCQVLVEFKRKRVLQYESKRYVAPGSYVVVGGDRGEDLGLVTYTWCEGRARGGGEEGAGGAGKGIRDAMLGGRIIHGGAADAAERNGKAPPANPDPSASTPNSNASFSNSNNSINGGGARTVIGIGLTGSTLTRSIGVGTGTVLRLASEKEVQQLHETQEELENRAIGVCAQRVLEHELSMVIVDAEYQFDKKKLTFFYQAQQRLDFRDLVRDLYKTFRARIWMEQV